MATSNILFVSYNINLIALAVYVNGTEMLRGILVVAWNSADQRVGSFTPIGTTQRTCDVSLLQNKVHFTLQLAWAVCI